MEENKQATGFATVRNVLKILAALGIVFACCPSFLVSCMGEDIKVDFYTGMKGMPDFDINGSPFLVLCILIPIAVLVLLFIKKMAQKTSATIILIATFLDFVIWFIFRNQVKKIAESNGCEFKCTIWFWLDMIVLILIILATAFIVAGKAQFDQMAAEMFAGSSVAKGVTAAAGVAGVVTAKTSGRTCASCGKPLTVGAKFCTNCGAPIEEVAEAPTEAPAEAPAEAPTEAPVETAAEAPAETAAEAPVEEPVEATVEEAAETVAEEVAEEVAEAESTQE